jgi:hypothetical protein
MTEARELAMALDPVLFSEELGIEPDTWQAQALRSEHKRMLFNCCRQSGKSTTASIKALHRGIFRPDQMVIVVSPSLRQSGELFRKISTFRKKLTWLPPDKEESRTAITLFNGSRLCSLPGSEDTVRGFSAVDLAVEDEAAQVDDDLYRSIRPMLAVSGGALLLMSTPRGKRGHFHNEWINGTGWEKYEVKAEDCPRIKQEFLDEEQRTLGDRWYRQEYENSFEEMEDQVFGFDAVSQAFVDDVKPLFGPDSMVSADVQPLFRGGK